MQVLLVDDSVLVRRRLSALLCEAPGVELQEASSAAEARRVLGTTSVELAVIDIHLGAESGLDLIDELKRRQPDAIVVVVTNDATPAHARACLERGADFFFDKSRDFERATNLVVELAEQSREARVVSVRGR